MNAAMLGKPAKPVLDTPSYDCRSESSLRLYIIQIMRFSDRAAFQAFVILFL